MMNYANGVESMIEIFNFATKFWVFVEYVYMIAQLIGVQIIWNMN